VVVVAALEQRVLRVDQAAALLEGHLNLAVQVRLVKDF
jgi:hypothetical protein